LSRQYSALSYIHAYIHAYIHSKSYSAQSYTKTERMCGTKVHPYTSNKLNKSNVKKVRLQGTSGGST